jgi:hypothetical protein
MVELTQRGETVKLDLSDEAFAIDFEILVDTYVPAVDTAVLEKALADALDWNAEHIHVASAETYEEKGQIRGAPPNCETVISGVYYV